MSSKSRKLSLICSLLILISIVITGCSQTTKDTKSDADTKSITINVYNLSNVSIGMFSVIDPATGEQINLDSLNPGESVTLSCNWPSGVTQFQWAVYNQNGELCMDASTDITQAEKSASLFLSGEDTIDNIKTVFDELP